MTKFKNGEEVIITNYGQSTFIEELATCKGLAVVSHDGKHHVYSISKIMKRDITFMEVMKEVSDGASARRRVWRSGLVVKGNVGPQFVLDGEIPSNISYYLSYEDISATDWYVL